MIFATDLDRTLIYSNAFLEKVQTTYESIEDYQGKSISYISIKALALLYELHQEAQIIPVTTRNYEQYHRVNLFKQKLIPEVYIVNNGGTIYYYNQEDLKWSESIRKQIKAMSVGYDSALKAFFKLYKGPIKQYKKSDDLLWYIVGEVEAIDWEALWQFEKQYRKMGWRVEVSGRKIYLMPQCINKWSALDYARNQYGRQEPIIAAGDSILDYEMLHHAEYGIVPKGAWIEDKCAKSIQVTKKEGIEAAEEILQMVLMKCRNQKEKSSNSF